MRSVWLSECYARSKDHSVNDMTCTCSRRACCVSGRFDQPERARLPMRWSTKAFHASGSFPAPVFSPCVPRLSLFLCLWLVDDCSGCGPSLRAAIDDLRVWLGVFSSCAALDRRILFKLVSCWRLTRVDFCSESARGAVWAAVAIGELDWFVTSARARVLSRAGAELVTVRRTESVPMLRGVEEGSRWRRPSDLTAFGVGRSRALPFGLVGVVTWTGEGALERASLSFGDGAVAAAAAPGTASLVSPLLVVAPLFLPCASGTRLPRFSGSPVRIPDSFADMML